MKEYRFPAGFLWGTSTAAHQVEGGDRHSDWWDWEQQPGHIRDGSRSGDACDHWNRFAGDFDLAAAMHTNAHRLGVEWARIEPVEGQWNGDAVAHYREVLKALRTRAIEPMVTLHHFVNPRWLAARGGWKNPGVVALFERYASFLARELGDLVRLWCTVNEPVGLAYQAYATGYWLPQQKSLGAAFDVLQHLLLGHAAAYRAVHSVQPQAQVGIPHYMRIFDPANPRSPLDRLAAGIRDTLFNASVLDALESGRLTLPLGMSRSVPEVAGACDYLGVDYYFGDRLAFDITRPGDAFGREVIPPGRPPDLPPWHGTLNADGFRRTCLRLSRYGKPIYVTENGFLDNTDSRRPAETVRHLLALWQAIQTGAPVKGYFHWSLMDNFEWAEGYTARFGLIHVDFATQKRTMKRSGELYAEICAANGLTEDMIARYAPEVLPELPDGGV